jgi:hypothetical protein
MGYSVTYKYARQESKGLVAFQYVVFKLVDTAHKPKLYAVITGDCSNMYKSNYNQL